MPYITFTTLTIFTAPLTALHLSNTFATFNALYHFHYTHSTTFRQFLNFTTHFTTHFTTYFTTYFTTNFYHKPLPLLPPPPHKVFCTLEKHMHMF